MANWLDTVFHGFDYSILSFYNGLANVAGGFLTPLMEFISFFGKGGIMMIVLGVVLLLFKHTRRHGLTALIGILIGWILVNLTLKPLVARARPYTHAEFQDFFATVACPTESENSFPSGHTNVIACTLSGIFFASKHKKYSWLLIIPVVLMAASRNYLMVHYPTDVIAGMMTGVLSGFLSHLLFKFLYKKMEDSPTTPFCWFMLNASVVDLFKKKK